MESYLEFEKPIEILERKLEDLRELSQQQGVDLSSEIKNLEKKVASLLEETYANLSPWQKVQLSRHPNRPYTRDYIEAIFPTFMELHGDRAFKEDPAIMAGIAHWPPHDPNDRQSPAPTQSVLVIGHQKGRTTKQKMERNFGMAKPEGYRKAIRLMEMASRLGIPIVTFIDTPGAYPGIETEERGQAQAIAESILTMAKLEVPVICVIIGEGGSGGALALGVGNRILMMEYSTYSVISPEGCASILWSDSKLAEQASERLKMDPAHLLEFGIIDRIIDEPLGGAHRDWAKTFRAVRKALMEEMDALTKRSAADLKQMKDDRIDKFRTMGNHALGRTTGDTLGENNGRG